MKPRKPLPKRRSTPRRGVIRDPDYMAWLATQPPLVPGAGRMTIHHVRRFGATKNDWRTIPLPSALHFIQENSETSIEALGYTKFERYHQVSIGAAILRYNRAYEIIREGTTND